MGDEEALLRGMIGFPEDAIRRLILADWLEERGDARAELLRLEWDIPRLVYIDWESKFDKPDVQRRWRNVLGSIEPAVDLDWLAVVDTLGRPFREWDAWGDSGYTSSGITTLPFSETIGSRGQVVTFKSSFRGDAAWQLGLTEDLRLLLQFPPGMCEYGAADCPVHPFICELSLGHRPLTGAAVLGALHVAEFRSEHILSLDELTIPYPGYYPRTENDEIHTDPTRQYIFPNPADTSETYEDDESARDSAVRDSVHQALRGAVTGGTLWYVLLHCRVNLPAGGMDRGPWVVLFAVGQSLRGDRLIGVVSYQMCHNLCD